MVLRDFIFMFLTDTYISTFYIRPINFS